MASRKQQQHQHKQHPNKTPNSKPTYALHHAKLKVLDIR